MKNRLNFYIKNNSKFTYNFMGLFKNYLGIPDDSVYSKFCSQFVMDILNAGRPNRPFVKDSSLVRPEDFKNYKFTKYICSGNLATYNPVEANNILIQKLENPDTYKESVILENPNNNLWYHLVPKGTNLHIGLIKNFK